MVQSYFELLPSGASTAVVGSLIVAALAGGALWLAGARFSRFLTTLITVTLGAIVGMHMPRWFGWNISGAGPAVGMAVVLGVSGFVLNGMWMGILLGLTLSLLTAFVMYACAENGHSIDFGRVSDISSGRELWSTLPEQITRILPYAAAICMVSAMAAAILWTRLTTVLAWSLFGATVWVASALAAVYLGNEELLENRLPQPVAQIGIMAGIVVLGVLIQWKLAPIRSKKKSKAKPSQRSGDSPAE